MTIIVSAMKLKDFKEKLKNGRYAVNLIKCVHASNTITFNRIWYHFLQDPMVLSQSTSYSSFRKR